MLVVSECSVCGSCGLCVFCGFDLDSIARASVFPTQSRNEAHKHARTVTEVNVQNRQRPQNPHKAPPNWKNDRCDREAHPNKRVAGCMYVGFGIRGCFFFFRVCSRVWLNLAVSMGIALFTFCTPNGWMNGRTDSDR